MQQQHCDQQTVAERKHMETVEALNLKVQQSSASETMLAEERRKLEFELQSKQMEYSEQQMAAESEKVNVKTQLPN